ncbi:DUF421 domain-containing protein [Methylocystis echinoides]|uniref:DUF421 domain-containing protein n=1 Tax=Methylocystis echinoides TaxID=29468 RepID=A0A9W6GV05_9HYPH|nr:YetF domain-containing protein [Methylocystis echinoides]GLI93375.1 DUF421 domain-containing protein [Methylocystis echinoides]
MFTPSISVVELILRAVCVYAFLFALIRFGGKKHVGEMAPFDFVLLLVLSETVQNALIGEDKSLPGGLVSAAALIFVSRVVGYASWRNGVAARFFEGVPVILVRHGKVREDALAREQITRSELMEALRREGCASLSRVRFAILENDGTITVGLNTPRAASAAGKGLEE